MANLLHLVVQKVSEEEKAMDEGVAEGNELNNIEEVHMLNKTEGQVGTCKKLHQVLII